MLPFPMRKASLLRSLCCRIFMVFLAGASVGLLTGEAQSLPASQGSSGAAMPNDPKELLRSATKINGLSGLNVKPWHLKASYQIFDQDGNPKGRGTYEELWVSQTRFKRSFSGDGFTQTRYGTENGTVQTGDSIQAPWQLDTLRYDLVTPLPREDHLDAWDFADLPAVPGQISRCVSMSGPLRVTISASGASTTSEKGILGVFCFAAERPLLETREQGTTATTTFNNPATLEGRWLPRDLEMKVKGQVVLSAHLEVFETIETVHEADFAPPAEATTPPMILVGTRHPPGQVQVSGGVAAAMLITKVNPTYPPIAHAARVQGTVVLQAVVGKGGQVSELRILSGPPMLQQAALDAVKQWVYRPYLLNGSPVEVMTTVNVVFQIPDLPAKP